MQEPEQYILEEWDSMCAKANKALHSDCPLLEDEVLVEMHKYVGALERKTKWLDRRFYQPKEEEGERILAYNTYIFECEYQDGVWCNSCGDDFTHWMPYIGEP